MVSSDFWIQEHHRIAIITEGRVSAILKPSDSNEDFGLAMSGITKEGVSA